MLSIIIPVVNEAEQIVKRLQYLQTLIADEPVELIVVDGGSSDNTVALARLYADHVVLSPKGRAQQMNQGARAALGESLLFLHLDTQLPADAFRFISEDFQWGFYCVSLSGQSIMLRLIGHMMSWRSQLTRVATGDQCLFIKKSLFDTLGGFPDIPLMEDVCMTKQLRKLSTPLVIESPVITSSRRWEKQGTIKTVFFMWYLRLLYFFGVSPDKLASWYYPELHR